MAREEKNEREDVRAAEESGALAVAETEADTAVEAPTTVAVVRCSASASGHHGSATVRCQRRRKRGAPQRHRQRRWSSTGGRRLCD
jgi:hypothetical protein